MNQRPLCHAASGCVRSATKLVPVLDADEKTLRGILPLCGFHYLRPNTEIPECPCRSCQQGLESICEVRFPDGITYEKGSE